MMTEGGGAAYEPGLAAAFAMLSELVAQMVGASSEGEVAALLTERVKWVVPCSGCTLLLEEGGGRWRLEPGGQSGAREELTQGLALALERRVVLTLPGPAGPLPAEGLGAAPFTPGTRTAMVLPLEVAGELLGTLNLSADEGAAFGSKPSSVYRLLQLNVAAVLHGVRLRRNAEHARAQAELATRKREELLALVAHDLRNPLSAIQLVVQLLSQQLGREAPIAPSALRASLGRVARQTQRMSGLVDELLDAAQLEVGKQLELHPARADLVALAREAVRDAQETTREHAVVLEAAEPELVGHWDARRLERVLGNLLGNAVKYSPGGGEVTLRVWAEGGWAVLEVQDRGVGIPASDLPSIFEPYFRATNVKGGTLGVGLGLHGARQIVVQHGGTLTAHSEEAQGTCMRLRLPLAPARTSTAH